MKPLNHIGIGKVIDHLTSIHGVKNISTGSDADGYFLITTEEKKIAKLLESTNVKTMISGGKLRLMAEEAVPPVTGTSTVAQDNIKTAADEEADKNGFDMNNAAMIKALADKLMPELMKYFPSKDQVNSALNMVKSGSVQGKELVGGLEGMAKKVDGK